MISYSFLEEAALGQLWNASRNVASAGIQRVAKSPVGYSTAIGAGAGALKGMKKDANGKRHIISGAMKGGAWGAGVGAAIKVSGGANQLQKLGNRIAANNNATQATKQLVNNVTK